MKKPLTAYMLFNNHRRPILKKEHTRKDLMGLQGVELSLPEVSKMIGDEWGKLTEDQKKVSIGTLLPISQPSIFKIIKICNI